eukprot:sb/3462312/
MFHLIVLLFLSPAMTQPDRSLQLQPWLSPPYLSCFHRHTYHSYTSILKLTTSNIVQCWGLCHLDLDNCFHVIWSVTSGECSLVSEARGKRHSDEYLSASTACVKMLQPTTSLTSAEDLVRLSTNTNILLHQYSNWNKWRCLTVKDGVLKWSPCAFGHEAWVFEVVGPGVTTTKGSLSVRVRLKNSDLCITSTIAHQPRWANETIVTMATCILNSTTQVFILEMTNEFASVMMNMSDGALFYAQIPPDEQRDASMRHLVFIPLPSSLMFCPTTEINKCYGSPVTNLTLLPSGMTVLMKCPGGESYTTTCTNRSLSPLIECSVVEGTTVVVPYGKVVPWKLLYTLAVDLLVRQEGLVDIKKDDGFSALHLAALNNHKTVAEIMIREGNCDINIRNGRLQTPLILAVSQGHTAIVELLVEHNCEVFILEMTNEFASVMMNMSDGALFYAQIPPDEQRDASMRHLVFIPLPSSLMFCPTTEINKCYGSPVTNLTLLPSDMAVLMKCPGGESYTTTCTNRSLSPLIECSGVEGTTVVVPDGKVVPWKLLYTLAVDLLVRQEGLVDIKKDDGFSALHLAALNNHKTVAEIMIREGNCDINIRNGRLQTPLILAVSQGHTAIVELLVEHNCEELLEKLAAAEPSFTTQIEQAVDLLVRQEGLVDIKKDDGFSALHLAALNNHKTVAEIMIREGNCDINIRNGRLQTPLILAVSQGHTAIVELLVEHNCEVDARDEEGDTALHLALVRQSVSTDHSASETMLRVNSNSSRHGNYGQ